MACYSLFSTLSRSKFGTPSICQKVGSFDDIPRFGKSVYNLNYFHVMEVRVAVRLRLQTSNKISPLRAGSNQYSETSGICLMLNSKFSDEQR